MDAPAIVSKLVRYIALGDREIAVLESLSRERRSSPAGSDLLDARQPYTTAFLIHEGWALRYRGMPDGRRQVINFLIPGDAFGLGALVLRRPDHNVAAITPITVSPIAPETLMALVREQPRVGAALLWSAAQEEAVLREHIVSIGRRTAYARVAHLLLELMHRLEQVDQAANGQFSVPLTQPLLADALGLSVVHVNRTLRRLQNDGLILVQSRHIAVLDYAALQRVAGFHLGYLHLPTTEAGSPLAQA